MLEKQRRTTTGKRIFLDFLIVSNPCKYHDIRHSKNCMNVLVSSAPCSLPLHQHVLCSVEWAENTSLPSQRKEGFLCSPMAWATVLTHTVSPNVHAGDILQSVQAVPTACMLPQKSHYLCQFSGSVLLNLLISNVGSSHTTFSSPSFSWVINAFCPEDGSHFFSWKMDVTSLSR